MFKFRILVLLCSLVSLGFGCSSPQLPSEATVLKDHSTDGYRKVFILLPVQDFTVAKLEEIFAHYRPQCVPNALEISIFSDRALLKERMERPIQVYLIDFASDAEGRKAAEKHKQELYFPAGTYVAMYNRFLYDEHFEYRLSIDVAPTQVSKYAWESNPYKCALEGNRS